MDRLADSHNLDRPHAGQFGTSYLARFPLKTPKTPRRSSGGAKHRQPSGSTTARGYGTAHQKLRARIAPQVAAGQATCARCGQPIHPAERWHLDHHDLDRSRYLGVSHE
ncbi:MAG TPA: hypothetical protein VF328_23045, partial [Mycobacterium sp.]